jgi:hypothetical protein
VSAFLLSEPRTEHERLSFNGPDILPIFKISKIDYSKASKILRVSAG